MRSNLELNRVYSSSKLRQPSRVPFTISLCLSAKILEQQKKLKDLEAQKVEEENAQIVQMVKAVHLDGTQLAAFLSAYASGEITLPQPEATYPAEQEDNDNEE